MLGKHAKELLGNNWKQYLQQQEQREELNDNLRISVPISVPGLQRNWAIIVTLPYKVVLAGADQLESQLNEMNRAAVTQQLVGAFIVLVLALATMLVIARSITGPIRQMVSLVDDIADGEGISPSASRPARWMSWGISPRGSTALSTSCKGCSGMC